MPKFDVHFETRDCYLVTVEADNVEAAKDKAFKLILPDAGKYWVLSDKIELTGTEPNDDPDAEAE